MHIREPLIFKFFIQEIKMDSFLLSSLQHYRFPLILAHAFVTLEITKLYTHAFWRVRKLRKR